MRLTQEKLKQIIKEEIDSLVAEGYYEEQNTDELVARRKEVVAITPRIRRSNSGEVSYLVRIGDSSGPIYYINKEAYEKFKQAERDGGMKRTDAEHIIRGGRFSKLKGYQLAAVANTFQQSGDRSLSEADFYDPYAKKKGDYYVSIESGSNPNEKLIVVNYPGGKKPVGGRTRDLELVKKWQSYSEEQLKAWVQKNVK